MKSVVWTAVLVLAALTPMGCGGSKTTPKLTAQELQKSFEKADASSREGAAQAASALQTGDYTQAILAIDQIAQTAQVNAAQKEAVNTLIRQTRQAVQQDPKLNTPELYKAMSDLVTHLHGEN